MLISSYQFNLSAMSIPATDTDLHVFHARLARYNIGRIAPAMPSDDWAQQERTALAWRLEEGRYLEALRKRIAPMLSGYAGSADHFVDWFSGLAQWGPGQGDPLFDYLAEEAPMAHMRWFLTQEAAGEAGFDDLVAYTQVKLPVQAKLECARNFWDEMGHGKLGAMHGVMLERMVDGLGLAPSIGTTVWQSLALGNAMLGMALNRRYAYHSLGALGVVELTAPGRVAKVAQGMRRLGLDAKMRAYFDLHAALDVSHSRCWNREILYSLVDADPTCARFLAEGALMRLYCGQRCFVRYRDELGIGSLSTRLALEEQV